MLIIQLIWNLSRGNLGQSKKGPPTVEGGRPKQTIQLLASPMSVGGCAAGEAHCTRSTAQSPTRGADESEFVSTLIPGLPALQKQFHDAQG